MFPLISVLDAHLHVTTREISTPSYLYLIRKPAIICFLSMKIGSKTCPFGRETTGIKHSCHMIQNAIASRL